MIGIRVSMRGTSRPVSDSGPLMLLLPPINTCVTQELDVVLCPKLGLKIEDIVLHRVGI